MAYQTFDRILETTTTTGTGPVTLAGAVTGFRTFASKLAVADTCHYHIEAVDGAGNPTGDWETGLGTYSAASTLTRTTVLDSSTGSAVSLVAGTKRVALSKIAFDDQPWTSAAFTIGASSGSLTATGTARYKQVGRTVAFNLTVVVTAVGTGTGFGVFSGLPFSVATAAAFSGVFGGSGATLVGAVSNTSGSMFGPGPSYPFNAIGTYSFSGTAEVA